MIEENLKILEQIIEEMEKSIKKGKTEETARLQKKFDDVAKAVAQEVLAE